MALTPARCVVAILTLAGAVGLDMSLSTTDLGSGRASEVVASRFMIRQALRPSQAMQRHASRVLSDTAMAFNPISIAAPQSMLPLTSVHLTAEDALQMALSLPAPPAALPPPASPPMEAMPLPTPRPARRPSPYIPDDRVFNDAQIASMKNQLNLTVEQERLWGAVELELQGLRWRRSSSRGNGAPILDVSAVQRLNLAYEQLARTLSEDQKRQVRVLMGIIGL
jgi:hypothetical protein